MKLKSSQKIRKAVFPVAGMGTRFLPATKASPKEMMPIVDKPLIQYAVEEAVAAGFTDMIFVTGRGKRAIEDHFDTAFELEAALARRGDNRLLHMVRNIVPRHVTCSYVRQSEALGLGHAILCAQPLVGDEPFAVVLADDLIDAKRPVLRQLLEVSKGGERSVLAVEKVAKSATRQYGIVKAVRVSPGQGLHRVSGIVEKPAPSAAPSRLGVVGRYLLTPRIFAHLRRIGSGAGGEIQLTDGIAKLLVDEDVFAFEFSGVRHDCGSKLGYAIASLEYARKHKDIGKNFHKYMIKKEYL
jgi:UTP--glucose-1-phosphate uridylyltransferase